MLQPQMRSKIDSFTAKLPIALGFYYLGLWVVGIPALSQALPFALAMLAVFFASGLFVRFYNDLFDMEADARGGKFNLARKVSPLWRALLLVFTTGVIALILLALQAPFYLYGLMGLQHLLYILYSTPPIRLKARRWGGVLTDAAYGHALPAAIALAFAFALAGQPPAAFAHLFLAVLPLLLLSGINNIIYHQLMDFRADEAAGIQTLAVAQGAQRLQNFGTRWLVPLEAIGLIALLAYLGSSLQAHLILALAPLALVHALACYRAHYQRRPHQLLVLFNEVYDTWLPLAIIGTLAQREPAYLLLLAFHLLLFFRQTGVRLFHYAARLKPVLGWLWKNAKLFYYHWLLKRYAWLLLQLGRGGAAKNKDGCAGS